MKFMDIPWQVINYTGAYVVIMTFAAAVAFGLWSLVTPGSDTWAPLMIMATILTIVSVFFMHKLQEVPIMSEGIGAVIVFVSALGLSAAIIWIVALCFESLPINAGLRAVGLMLTVGYAAYSLFIAVDSVNAERNFSSRSK